MLELNKLYIGNNVELMKEIDNDQIDLTVTSPPYDNLRKYNGYSFDFENVAKELYRITKQGGVVVWVVGDKTEKGSETGTSFKQALFFKEIGFNLHDTMIYQKIGGLKPNPSIPRYAPDFEYMFVLSKGKPKSFNEIRIPCSTAGEKLGKSKKQRQVNGELKGLTLTHKEVQDTKRKGNIWAYGVGYNKSTTDKIAFEHSAIFPEQLAKDHILSWSNEGDIVFDPFVGSGTTAKMAMLSGRNYIGIDISQEYIDIANERINTYK